MNSCALCVEEGRSHVRKLTEELVRVGKYLDTKATALFILYYLDIKNGGRHFINCIIKEVPRNDYFIWVSNVM